MAATITEPMAQGAGRGGKALRVKNLFDATAVEEVKERMARLRPDSERQWGKMSPAQMLAHCSAAIGMAVGETRRESCLDGCWDRWRRSR